MCDNVAFVESGVPSLQFRWRFCRVSLTLVALALLSTAVTADSPRDAFVHAWKGQTVVLRSALYSLVYNERGKLGTTHSKREGLLVVTSTHNEHLQFNGRQGRETVIAREPAVLVTRVSTAYQPDTLDVRSYRKLEPLAVEQFVSGSELLVTDIAIERNEITITFDLPDGSEKSTTSLRIHWPLPLSAGFRERQEVERLMRRFVEVKAP